MTKASTQTRSYLDDWPVGQFTKAKGDPVKARENLQEDDQAASKSDVQNIK